MKLISAILVIAAAVLVGWDAYNRYRQAQYAEPYSTYTGSVQVLVPQVVDGVVTRVSPGIRGPGNTVYLPWGRGNTEKTGKPALEIAVIWPTRPKEAPQGVGILLKGPVGEQFIDARIDGVDDQTGHGMALVTVDSPVRLDWCRRSQCFVTAPTVLPPLLAPWLRSAPDQVNRAERNEWWDRFEDPLHRNAPQKLNGLQEVDAGYLPLTVTLDVASPASTIPKQPDGAPEERLRWRSEGEITALGKVTDSDRDADRQDSIFVAGVEIGIAASLIPWALQIFLDLWHSRTRLRRRS